MIDLLDFTVQCFLCLASLQDLNENKENKTPVVRFCAVSALESSHKGPITDVHWLPQTFEVQKSFALKDRRPLEIFF